MRAVQATRGTKVATRLVVGPRSMLLRGGQDSPFGRIAPVVPVWRVLIGRPGPITSRVAGRAQHAAGLLVPPDVPIDARVPGVLAILHLDADGYGMLPRAAAGRPQVVPLFAESQGLRELWWLTGADGLDVVSVEVLRELRAGRLLPPPSSRDRRVMVGLEAARELGGIAQGAATVGLSNARFRGLVREQVGTSPTRLRTWQRLRAALALIGALDLAEAAATAGFADQAHLTRTSTRLLGASPGRLRAHQTNVANNGPRAWWAASR